MMQEYERLYTEFLTKSIKAEKEKMEMRIKLNRVNWIQGCICCFMNAIDCRRIKQKIMNKRRNKRELAVFGAVTTVVCLAILVFLYFVFIY
jgi:uncharacterized membrane protein